MRITIGAGIGQDKNGVALQAGQVHFAVTAIEDRAAAMFGGATILRTHGIWRDDKRGELAREAGVTVLIYTEDSPVVEQAARQFAEFVRDELGQACVAFVVERGVNVEFV